MKRFLPRTLRARLTVLIAVSTSAILALSGIALYEALRSRIEGSASEQMASIMIALRSHLNEAGSIDDIPRDAEWWTDQLHDHPNIAMAIYDRTGAPLLQTKGFEPLPPSLDIASPASAAGITRAASTFRYLLADQTLDGPARPTVRVVLQYDGRQDAALLRAYAGIIAVIEVLGVVLAAACAYGIAMFGLSPLRRLVSRAEQMSTTRLAHPLPAIDASGELKELELAFNGMLQRLNESFTRLSEFSSNMAHDIRTPLTNLQAAAQVALSKERSAEEYKDVIEASIDEFQRLSRMVEDMLFLARAERADMLLDVKRLDATKEAGRVAGFYESVADEANVSIHVTGHAYIDADLLLLQRALSNLISNAIAHAPGGSTVEVECRQDVDGATVSVSDTGMGIRAPHIERVFDRFYRVDPARHNAPSGSGLGLAIVRSIMESHGGTCGVQSRPHVHTRFWLTFPRHESRPADAAV